MTGQEADPGQSAREPEAEPDAKAELDDLDPQRWFGEPDVCGSCIAWRSGEPEPEDEVATGVCRLRPELPRVPATLRRCDLYKPRGQFVYQPTVEPGGRRKRRADARVLRRSAELASRVLDRCGGNVSEAARVLGVPRSTLRYRLRAVASGRHPTQLGLPGIAE